MFSSFWQPVSPLCGHRSAETPRPWTRLFVTCQGAARAWPSPGTCLMAASLQTRSKVSVTGLRLQIVLHPFPSPLEAPASWVPAWPDVGITACPCHEEAGLVPSFGFEARPGFGWELCPPSGVSCVPGPALNTPPPRQEGGTDTRTFRSRGIGGGAPGGFRPPRHPPCRPPPPGRQA